MLDLRIDAAAAAVDGDVRPASVGVRGGIVVVALAAEGSLHRVEIDTSHFKYNASAEVEVWGRARGAWVPVLARTPLVPDTLHRFAVSTGPLAQLRLDAYPDGGLARFKAFGTPIEAEPP